MQSLRQLPNWASHTKARSLLSYASKGTESVCLSTRRLATAAAQHRKPTSTTDATSQELSARRQSLQDAKPFSDFLTDTFQRQHDYLRISVTERCNLRCVYCMPEEGVPLSPSRELLTTPEIVMLSSVFQIGALRSHGLKELCLTTNGISLHRKLDSMVEAGLTGINMSLDTLDPWQFQIMTRRKGFDAVQRSIDRVLEMNRAGAGIRLKINCVVMRGVNDREVLPFVDLTRDKDIEIRFIEYMPFDGNKWNKRKMLSYDEMLDMIRVKYPTLQKVQDHKNDTSKTWHVPGFAGRIGFITSMTHNFCGTCNRLRITGDGNLKVCLFGDAEVSLRDILRQSNGGEPIDEAAYEAMKQIEMDRRQGLTSPDTPLGMAPNEAELLDIIGLAVKRKKAKHAGIGQLEHMKNRPMILIDPVASTLHGAMPPRMRHLTSTRLFSYSYQRRLFASTPRHQSTDDDAKAPKLTHVSETGAAHMVGIASKAVTSRIATAACTVRFSGAVA
ncbi:hypothetical protein LLEC1_02825, partial [Akanthomyces lecanii]